MKQLVLVNPSTGFNNECIPLGLASISAYLKKYGGDIEITFLDANCQDIYKDFRPVDIVAVTAVTQDIGKAIDFARFVKKYNKKIPIILGGVHITAYRELPEPFSLGVIGEGEETMLELSQLDKIDSESICSIKGICYRKDGKTVFTEPRPLIEPLDKIPMPDRDIANMEYYLKPKHIIPYHTGRTLTMLSSRGCSFNCRFCSTRIHWQKFRAFSAKRVVEEIELLVNNYGAEIIHIFDDLFIADKKRFADIHDLIVSKGLNKKVKFMCLVRSDMLDDKTMRMLKEMNVVVTGIGMESGCPRTLEYLKRNTTTVEKNREAIELSNKYNIPTMGSFMIGNPGETEEELLKTLEFIKEYRYSPYLSPLPYIATAFPGTEFWKYAKDRGLPDDFDNITMDIPKTVEALKKSQSLLTDIPPERFFDIAQMFVKESRYGALKQYVFLPKSPLDFLRAFVTGIYIEKNPVAGMVEVIKILRNFYEYRKMAESIYVPVVGKIPYNCILDDYARELYEPAISQMFKYAPKMMGRKIPRSTVQHAFVLNSIYKFVEDIKFPKILCVGSFEDATAECLKVMGYAIEEIDPHINYDLSAFVNLKTTILGSYDIVFSTSVLEHVDNDGEFVAQIGTLLKPGGFAILTCDFENDYKPGDKLPKTDVRFYTERDMYRLVAHAKGCYFVGGAYWFVVKPDFFNEGCRYSFATLTLRKDKL